MTEMKIEYAIAAFLGKRDPKAIPADIPVVRLEAVDAVLAEAVWAMELLEQYLEHDHEADPADRHRITKAFASDIVTQWRERQKAGQP